MNIDKKLIQREVLQAVNRVFADSKAISDPNYFHGSLQKELVALGQKLGYSAVSEKVVNFNHHGHWEKDKIDVVWYLKERINGKPVSVAIFELDHFFSGKNLVKLDDYPWECPARYGIYFGGNPLRARNQFKEIFFKNDIFMPRLPVVLAKENDIYQAVPNPVSFEDWVSRSR